MSLAGCATRTLAPPSPAMQMVVPPRMPQHERAPSLEAPLRPAGKFNPGLITGSLAQSKRACVFLCL